MTIWDTQYGAPSCAAQWLWRLRTRFPTFRTNSYDQLHPCLHVKAWFSSSNKHTHISRKQLRHKNRQTNHRIVSTTLVRSFWLWLFCDHLCYRWTIHCPPKLLVVRWSIILPNVVKSCHKKCATAAPVGPEWNASFGSAVKNGSFMRQPLSRVIPTLSD